MAHLHGIRIGNYDMPPSEVGEIVCILGKQFEGKKKKKKKKKLKDQNTTLHLKRDKKKDLAAKNSGESKLNSKMRRKESSTE
ncbi:hypothetical protein VN97_g6555 [Penicillium thymicola]|uniref:Uncharacterized protein n=1 Tax=Penicillium thymicola TaxID=293382 RepID=A0AAI9TGP9_PENTH|nr:hypothetical protein VN97_g6555 [Penicillium thymicola]